MYRRRKFIFKKYSLEIQTFRFGVFMKKQSVSRGFVLVEHCNTIVNEVNDVYHMDN